MKLANNSDYCNEKKFSAFFKEQSKLLFNFIFYKCGSEALSNDILQDAFLKFWENCEKILPGKAKSYLFTIANRLFLNEYAKTKVKISFKNEVKKDTTNENPEFLLEEKEFNSKLEKAIANLPETQRVTFLLHRIDGKKYKEIAEILGISVKAVEKRMHLALINLRKEIEIL
ncbi:MAG: RNA polymerase sigma factor [Lutibacter sp.]